MTVNYTGVNGGTFNNLIPGPAAGEPVTKDSIGLVAQAAANQDKHLYDTKVAKAGDTMTGKLTVFAAGSSNQAGVDATGDGGGPGVYATGGDGDATGVVARGGKNNGHAVDAVADGLGTGVIAVGGDAGGYGVYVTGGSHPAGVGGIGLRTAGGVGPGGTGRALEVGAGNAVFTGASPAATADPGANNALSGANICKAWAVIETDSMGGATLVDGYNIASVTANGNYVEVNLARAFPNNNYCPVPVYDEAQAYWCTSAHSVRTASMFPIYFKSAGGAINPATTVVRATVVVYGRQ